MGVGGSTALLVGVGGSGALLTAALVLGVGRLTTGLRGRHCYRLMLDTRVGNALRGAGLAY